MNFRYFKVDTKTTEADLKKQKRMLAKKNHPDKGGSTAVMSAINDEYDKALKWIKNPYSQPKTNHSKSYSSSQSKSYKSNPFNDFNDFFSQGGFDDFMKAHFGGDYQQREQYYQQKYQREREYRKKQREEEERRYREELRKRVYQFKSYVRVNRFRKDGREEIIRALNKHAKFHKCKLFVSKKKPLKWYQLYERIEFKVKSKIKYNVKDCYSHMNRKFQLPYSEIFHGK